MLSLRSKPHPGGWHTQLDLFPLDLQAPAVGLPVKFWLPAAGPDRDPVVEKMANDDGLTAEAILNGVSWCGFLVGREVGNMPAADLSRDLSCQGLEELPTLRFDVGKINVYYVGKVLKRSVEQRGITCKVGEEGAMIMVSTQLSNPQTLVHELGHTLGLAHTADNDDPLDGLTSAQRKENIMFSEESSGTMEVRKRFDAGQCLRMHASDDSIVRKLKLRSEASECAADHTRCLPTILARRGCMSTKDP